MKDEMTQISLDDISSGHTPKTADSGDTDNHHHYHHRHHHHHHHHSSGTPSKRRKYKRTTSSAVNDKKKRKVKEFFKNNKKRLFNIAIALVVVVALIVGAVIRDLVEYTNKSDRETPVSSGVNSSANGSIQIEVPVFTDEVNLVTGAVLEYIDEDNTLSVSEIYNKYSSEGRIDAGLPVNLYYNVLALPSGCSVASAKLLVSEHEDFASPRAFDLPSNKRSVDVYNLKTNTQYYYRFTLRLSDDNTFSVNGSFKTADTPRLLNVDGVYNARDIGGLKTTDGRSVKQGVLYRGTELDGAVQYKYSLTPEGLTEMLAVLGINTDMDLRAFSDSNGQNALGSNVEHNCYNAYSYNDAFTEEGNKVNKQIFSDLAKKENYPVYLHCTYGMDRTGTICYLLEALLGVTEEQCRMDYELSALHHSKVYNDSLDTFILQLKSFGGESLKSNAENYLLSIGVTPDEITSIREMLLSE